MLWGVNGPLPLGSRAWHPQGLQWQHHWARHTHACLCLSSGRVGRSTCLASILPALPESQVLALACGRPSARHPGVSVIGLVGHSPGGGAQRERQERRPRPQGCPQPLPTPEHMLLRNNSLRGRTWLQTWLCSPCGAQHRWHFVLAAVLWCESHVSFWLCHCLLRVPHSWWCDCAAGPRPPGGTVPRQPCWVVCASLRWPLA